MNNSTLKYVAYKFETIYFDEESDNSVYCAISGTEGSGSGTYSLEPERSDS